MNAAAEVALGNVEASLGGSIFKKRVAYEGRGKRGSSRTLIACREGRHTFYLHGFNKNEISNISPKELGVLRHAAEVWFSKSQVELNAAVEAGVLVEIVAEDK